MQCPDTGTWQAYLDGEVAVEENNLFEQHLESCPGCKDIVEELTGLENWSYSKLNTYSLGVDALVGEPKSDGIQNNEITKPEGVKLMKRKFTKWAAVAASTLLISGALTLAPVQEAVADFLSIFRVQKIEVIQLDPGDLEEMAAAIQSRAGEIDLKELGKVDVAQELAHAKVPVDEVQAKLPFEFKQPAYVPEGFIQAELASVFGAGKSEFRLDVEKVNALLKSLGSDTLLPASLSGNSFTVNTPAVAQVNYMLKDGEMGFSMSQFESPEIIAPSGVDVNALRAALLDLPILPDDLRKQLASIEDWQHTLVLPSAEETEELAIAGNEAIFARGKGTHSYLMWIDNGVIYQLNGQLDRNTAVKIANSLYQSN